MNDLNYFKGIEVSEIITNLKNDQGNGVIEINSLVDMENSKVIAIKDIHSNLMMNTTFGSAILKDYKSPYESTVVSLLKKDGFNIVCSANLDEFAMGSTNLTSHFGGVSNALDYDKISGGSSGGSAYLVASGLLPVATGTDTGGSVRQPAAFNGIYGMKPTYGLISRYGTLSFASSFDTVGVLSNTVADNIEVLECLAKNDHQDQTNFVPNGYNPKSRLDEPIKNTRVGVFRNWIEEDGVDPEVKLSFLNELKALEELGCVLEDVDIPLTSYSFELYVALAYAEASSNINRYDGIRFGHQDVDAIDVYNSARNVFGSEVKKRIIIGTYMINSEHSKKFYVHAQKIRRQITDEFLELFNHYDVLVGPTTPNVAFGVGETKESRTSYLSDKFAIPANLAGIPSMNVPVHKASHGAGIGMQIMANKYDEAMIYKVAKHLEGRHA